MKLKVVCIHGIHSKEGENNMSRFAESLAPLMPTAEVSVYDYGFVGFWEARWKNKEVAYDLASMWELERRADDFEVWITHSNGAAVAYLAARNFAARPQMIVNINPALDRWRTAPVKWVETIHSPGDRVVHLSQWLPGHIWGDQGKVGYRGRLKNTINHDAATFEHPMRYNGHLEAFANIRRERWAAFVAARIESIARITEGRL